MHKITLEGVPSGPFLTCFAYLYEQLSVKPLPARMGDGLTGGSPVLKGLSLFLHDFYSAAGQGNPKVIERTISPLTYPTHKPKRVALSFSGGKDSLAAAILLKNQGYAITAIHIQGLNRAYPHEVEYSRKLSEGLGIPFLVFSARVTGRSDFVANPVRNFLILAAMVEWGLPKGITEFAFGCDDHIGLTVNPNYNMSDGLELFDRLSSFYKRYIPEFKSHFPVRDGTHSYWTIHKFRPDLWGKFESCMMPLYRRPLVRRANLAKGIKLEGIRCGSCKKCSYEYLHGVLLGVDDFNQSYFDRCVESLRKNAKSNDPSQEEFTPKEAVGKYVNLGFLRDNGIDIGYLEELQ